VNESFYVICGVFLYWDDSCSSFDDSDSLGVS